MISVRRRYWENSFIILTWISPSGVDFLDWLSQLWDILRSKRKDINITPLNLLVCVAYPCLMTGNHLCLILFIRVINFINQNNLCPVLVIPGHSLELRVPFTVFWPLDVIIFLLYCFFLPLIYFLLKVTQSQIFVWPSIFIILSSLSAIKLFQWLIVPRFIVTGYPDGFLWQVFIQGHIHLWHYASKLEVILIGDWR